MAILHLHELGARDGAPLLAIHGITGHGRRYRRLAEEAWPARRTIAVDLRGHGRSTNDGPWSIPQHVRDLVDTLDSLGIDRLDVVGHSYGGAIGLALLAAAPERVARLVLLDPALAVPGAGAAANALVTLGDPSWATVEDATIARNTGLGDEINPGVAEDVAEHLVRSEDGRYRFRYDRAAVVTGWGEVANPLPSAVTAVSALLVVADRANLVTPTVLDGLHGLFGDSLSVVHLDCGHMVYWEDFEGTAAATASFLLADQG
jgi:lipase